ncbi:MAG: hypothetical protein ABSB91_09075 [Sedimentisphaerales bacterium]
MAEGRRWHKSRGATKGRRMTEDGNKKEREQKTYLSPDYEC